MAQYWPRDVAHVVGCGEVATANCRKRFCAEQQSDGGARAGAIMHRRMIARAPHDIYYIALHARLDPHMLYLGATTRNRVDFTERLDVNSIEATSIEAGIPTGHDLQFIFSRRIREQNLQQKASELRFGQRVSALVFDRIFGCEHTEQRRQRISFAIYRDLSLFHRFQEGCLCLWRRAIDLVGEQNVREHRTMSQVET